MAPPAAGRRGEALDAHLLQPVGTLLLEAGIHPKVVQQRLGHSSISFTIDVYSHAVPSLQVEAAERGAELLDGEDEE